MVFYRECCLFYMVWWLLSRQIARTSSKWMFKWKIRFSKSFDIVTKIFIICKRVVWMCVNNDMNLLRIWLALLIKLQTSCLIIVNTRENIFKQQISMLILLRGMFTVAKKFNRFVYDVDHIVEDIFLVNDLINILFAVCKLFV